MIIPALTALILCVVVLYFTQTRAAILLMVVGFVFLQLFYLTKKQLLIIIAIGLLVLSAFFEFLDIADFKDYFRIKRSILATTSGRSDAIAAALLAFGESPIIGLGFGSADKSMPFAPTNLFYFLMPVEIGLLGALGVLGILTSCFSTLIWQALSKDAWKYFNQTNPLATLSCVSYLAILAYSVAEFVIFRISATNQLFFFFWSVNFILFRATWLQRK